ncbi:TPA: PH domain-containing protein [Staphylococcus aureus]|nr:PH domain-containing protein [Staphylococcus aureus]
MKELPKSRLTFKESMIESQYLATKTKEEKKQYKQLSVEDKREILKEYQSKHRKEVKELPMILKDNENIMYVTSGLYNNNTYLIVCTDLRLLFLDKGMIYGLKFHEFPFEKINSVSYKKGLLFGEIIIHHGSSSIAIGSISKNTVSRMAETIQEQISIRESSMKPSNSEKMSFSVADELIKYKELLDVGVISQEEFDKKKQQLLDID